MSIADKSLEELKACEMKIAAELKKKEDELILANGGFTCDACHKVFSKDHQHREIPGLCHDCGWEKRRQDLRTEYTALEVRTDPTKLPPVPTGVPVVVSLVFRRDYPQNGFRPIRLECDEGILAQFIIKAGDKYYALSTTLSDDPDDIYPTLRRIPAPKGVQ